MEGARSVSAFGPGGTNPLRIMNDKGGSHAGPEGRRPHCGATKEVTGGYALSGERDLLGPGLPRALVHPHLREVMYRKDPAHTPS